MQPSTKVLLIEDDRGIAAAVVQALRGSYDIEVALTGKLGLHKANYQEYKLIILDLHLPDMSGLAVCQHLRDRGLSAPILILSGENRTLTKINLLDAGADDYLTKPFSLGELKARMRVLIRNSHAGRPAGRVLEAADIRLNRRSHEVSRGGVPIRLRRKEFAVLECLMEHAGAVVSREMLLRQVWNEQNLPWTNTIDVHIKYLRDKLDRPFGKHSIRTVHGRGYKLEVEATGTDKK